MNRSQFQYSWAAPQHPKAVVVGCTAEQQDILPHWWSCYVQHNRYPVYFADFGMSCCYVQACMARGHVISMLDVPLPGWHRKPFCILRTPAQKIIWTDLDIEIGGDLDEVFCSMEPGKISAVQDLYCNTATNSRSFKMFRARLGPTVPIYDSGILAVNNRDDTMMRWAAELLRRPDHYYYGDQEPLALLFNQDRSLLHELQPSRHPMRLPDPGLYVKRQWLTFHWTGLSGKGVMRDMLKVRPNVVRSFITTEEAVY